MEVIETCSSGTLFEGENHQDIGLSFDFCVTLEVGDGDALSESKKLVALFCQEVYEALSKGIELLGKAIEAGFNDEDIGLGVLSSLLLLSVPNRLIRATVFGGLSSKALEENSLSGYEMGILRFGAGVFCFTDLVRALSDRLRAVFHLAVGPSWAARRFEKMVIPWAYMAVYGVENPKAVAKLVVQMLAENLFRKLASGKDETILGPSILFGYKFPACLTPSEPVVGGEGKTPIGPMAAKALFDNSLYAVFERFFEKPSIVLEMNDYLPTDADSMIATLVDAESPGVFQRQLSKTFPGIVYVDRDRLILGTQAGNRISFWIGERRKENFTIFRRMMTHPVLGPHPPVGVLLDITDPDPIFEQVSRNIADNEKWIIHS